MTTTPFSKLVDLQQTGEKLSTIVTEDWLQGRSTFGGLTAALCYEAVRKSFSDLPPLRSIQVSFIGPASGEVSFTTKLLRQGRNVAFVQAEMHGESGLSAICIFCFGTTRDSQQSRNEIQKPDALPPEDLPLFFPEGHGPGFAQHLSHRLVKGSPPLGGGDDADNVIWVKALDYENVDAITSLIAIGDAVPPAEMSAFKVLAPISSMTWLMNFLTDSPETEDGWWLMKAYAEHTENGYSSQNMYGWNKKGEPVFAARQSIAIFA